MIPERAQAIIDHIGHITGPANFEIVARYDMLRDVVAVGITAHWPDIHSPRIVQTHIERPVALAVAHDTIDATFLNGLVFDAILTLWDHELHEHVRYDGVPIIDPHPNGGFR